MLSVYISLLHSTPFDCSNCIHSICCAAPWIPPHLPAAQSTAVVPGDAPPAASQTEPASLATLPLELVHLIIKHALPAVRWRTFKQRYDTLRRLALVERRWARLAQQELWRHVCAMTSRRLDALIEIINLADTGHAPDPPPWQGTASLRLQTPGGYDGSFCVNEERLVSFLPNYEELWLYATSEIIGLTSIGGGSESLAELVQPSSS